LSEAPNTATDRGAMMPLISSRGRVVMSFMVSVR
jgi:hypothetical protein